MVFRSLTEMGRYDEAVKLMPAIESSELKRSQREMYAAAKTDFYVRQRNYAQAVTTGEELLKVCKSMKRKPPLLFYVIAALFTGTAGCPGNAGVEKSDTVQLRL